MIFKEEYYTAAAISIAQSEQTNLEENSKWKKHFHCVNSFETVGKSPVDRQATEQLEQGSIRGKNSFAMENLQLRAGHACGLKGVHSIRKLDSF